MKLLSRHLVLSCLALAAAVSGRPALANDIPPLPRMQFAPAPVTNTPASTTPAANTVSGLSWRMLSEARVDSSGIFLCQIVTAPSNVVLPQIRLAPAPPLGQTITFSRDQVIALAGTNFPAMSATNWTGPARARVSRRVRPLDETELTGLLAGAIQHDYVKDAGELELRFASSWTVVLVPDEPITLTITQMPAAGVNPNFVAGFELWNGRERVGHWQAVLQARVWRPMPVARTALTRGQLLRDADLVMERRDSLSLHDVVLNIPKDDDSLALVENIAPGLPIPNRAVRPRPAVKRGQMVEGVFEEGSLTISLKVEILEDGLPGQTVRVRNPKTNRELTGKVQNEETIRITL